MDDVCSYPLTSFLFLSAWSKISHRRSKKQRRGLHMRTGSPPLPTTKMNALPTKRAFKWRCEKLGGISLVKVVKKKKRYYLYGMRVAFER
jgi:hypothetical protein